MSASVEQKGRDEASCAAGVGVASASPVAPSILRTVVEREPIPENDLVLVSVGITCQTAHQLARYAAETPGVSFRKGPLDWLALPPPVVAAWLDAGLDPFGPGDIEVRDGRPWFARRAVGFWHAFRRKPREGETIGPEQDMRGTTKLLDVPYAFERELAKLTYQTGVFRALDPARTLFVTSNGQNNAAGPGPENIYRGERAGEATFTGAGIDALQGALDRYFDAPCRLGVVAHEGRMEPGLDARGNVEVVRDYPADWHGDDADWDRVLGALVERVPVGRAPSP